MGPDELRLAFQTAWYGSLIGKLCLCAMGLGAALAALGALMMFLTGEAQGLVKEANRLEKMSDPERVMTSRDWRGDIRPGDPLWKPWYSLFSRQEGALYLLLAGVFLLCLGALPILLKARAA